MRRYAGELVQQGAHVVRLRHGVKCFLQAYFAEDRFCGDDALLVDDFGADSLDLLQVAYSLNDMFGIDIDADSLPELLTVGGACDLVERLWRFRQDIDN